MSEKCLQMEQQFETNFNELFPEFKESYDRSIKMKFKEFLKSIVLSDDEKSEHSDQKERVHQIK